MRSSAIISQAADLPDAVGPVTTTISFSMSINYLKFCSESTIPCN
ncbi:hypothetical protein EPHNCH_0689 [Anaplasma phagocytophilum str. NCH-1]|uniref:Uncharacterized protein n=1 Tax=Anaplasma phagocytophilum str. NCH-1 TaxID=1359161 RepID=A0A0F3NEK0_ANAPH|nr:hypothetical protein EPHNCH_0689 [Anaplasma phagocytophilum str. NCH-1]